MPNKKELLASKKRLETNLELVEEDLRTFRRIRDTPTELENLAFAKALDDLFEQSLSILITKILNALNISREYNREPFRSGLLTAAQNSDTILVTYNGGGKVEVVIDLNKTAGSLEDWANGVRGYREYLAARRSSTLGGRSPRPSSFLGSWFWAEKIYGSGAEGTRVSRRRYNRKTQEYETIDVSDQFSSLWSETIAGRLSISGKLAPWWELLDKGSLFTRLSSDLSPRGEPYPVQAATHFVNSAVGTIKALFESNFSFYMDEAKESILRSINEALQKKDEIERDLEIVNTELYVIEDMEFRRTVRILREREEREEKERLERLDRQRKATATKILTEKIGENFRYVRPERLEKLLEDLSRGIVSQKNGFYLGRTSTGHVIRPRMKKLIEQIDKELGIV